MHSTKFRNRKSRTFLPSFLLPTSSEMSYHSRTLTPPVSPAREAESVPKRRAKPKLSHIRILVETTYSVEFIPLPHRTPTSSLSSASFLDSPASERANFDFDETPTFSPQLDSAKQESYRLPSDSLVRQDSFQRLPPTPTLQQKEYVGFPRTETSYFPSSGGLWKKAENEQEEKERIEFEQLVGRHGWKERETLVKVWENEKLGEVEQRVRSLEEKIARERRASEERRGSEAGKEAA